MRSILRLIAWSLVLGAVATACITAPSERITALRFDESEYTLIVGETRRPPTPSFVNDFGYFPVDTGTRFEIADTTVARLAADGMIVAGATPGITSITAVNGAFTASTVLRVSASYFVWPDAMRLIPGASRKAVVHAEELAAGRTIAQSSW